MDGRMTRVPDGIGPIIGYRAWRYRIEPQRLYPLTSVPAWAIWNPSHRTGRTWKGASSDWVTASCRTHGREPMHVAPAEGCSCGFYAFRELASSVRTSLSSDVVLGRVELAGKVIEHDWGFRAQRARIVELIPLRGAEGSVRVLASRLGVPIAQTIDPPGQGLTNGPSPPPGGTGSSDPAAFRERAADLLRIAALCALVGSFLVGAHTGTPSEAVSVSLTPSLVLLALSQICRTPRRR
jgi:hypothetical protein